MTLGPLARMSELSQIHGQRSLRFLRGCPIIYSASGCGCEGDLP